jgi:hypothetical protein
LKTMVVFNWKTIMKKKNIISLTIALTFLFLASTGILLYFGLKPEPVTAIHVLLGILFISFAFFHVKNNWGSLKVYTKERKEGKIKNEFLVATAVVVILLIGAGFGLPPFKQIQHFGEDLTRDERKGGFFDKTSFDKVATNKDKQGNSLQFIIEKTNEAITPVIAIWVEDTAGNFVDNIFVPSKTVHLAPGEEDARRALFEGKVETKNFTPAMLPDWQSKTKDTSPNYPDATPTDNFFLHTTTKAAGKFQIVLEVKNGEKNELYKGVVDMSKGDAFVLKSTSNSLLARVIVEVK